MVPGHTPHGPAASRAAAARRRLLAAGAAGVAALALTASAAVAQTPAASVSPTATTASADPVGAGDKVVLRVFLEPKWSDAYPVDAAGVATLPRIGPMRVAGLSPAALKDSVQTRLAVYLRDPVVDVIVLRRIAVLGAVRKPDVLYVEPVATLSDLIAQAGGIDEDGDPDRIEIVRGATRVRLGKWRDIGPAVAAVHSGDQIVVGRRSWISRNALAAISSAAVAVSVLVTAVRR